MLIKRTEIPWEILTQRWECRARIRLCKQETVQASFFAFHHYTVGNGWVCSADKEPKSILEVLHVKLYGGIAEKTHSAFLFN